MLHYSNVQYRYLLHYIDDPWPFLALVGHELVAGRRHHEVRRHGCLAAGALAVLVKGELVRVVHIDLPIAVRVQEPNENKSLLRGRDIKEIPRLTREQCFVCI